MKIDGVEYTNHAIIQDHVDTHFKNLMGQGGEYMITFNKNIWEGSHVSLEDLEKNKTEEEVKPVIGGLAKEKI